MSRLTEHTRSKGTWRRAVGHRHPGSGTGHDPGASSGEGAHPPCALPLRSAARQELPPPSPPLRTFPGSGGRVWTPRKPPAGKKMPAFNRLFPLASLVLIFWVSVCFPVCVEVPSETEAVQGNPMKLRCISCMKREEVEATTVVEWFYRPEGGKDFLIYEYRNGQQEVESPFQGRLQWNGSKDLQDVSITVLNVTLNDSGLYTCNVSREFAFEAHRPFVKTTRLIPLRVTEEAGEDFTSVVSEIMMYILLVFLTLWLLIEMIYCYRKVSKAEEAAQENASDYLAIPSENKESSAVPVEE
ncbi:sodium channel subunit beta-3 isoform X1 [Mustela nigripes]|uniref:Sodium channel regulatory subunit beta-3 n=4 Tax=Caniformia TaxID=379584 RepID=A0A8U0TCF8_MUSPF|nr:sodium channel subunit beta-3 isoform X1 [Mustela putorius furo]XP_059039522.1 sodium channel subunit beta-3 isoform X1 [Mustela lutreola]XP_059270732.1 sodium channel subunit beta-3 isoform X1 [Mustela nigripes]